MNDLAIEPNRSCLADVLFAENLIDEVKVNIDRLKISVLGLGP